MKNFIRVLGVLLILAGAVWFLQGINVLPGSIMTGQIQWAIYGGIAVVVGILLLLAPTGAGLLHPGAGEAHMEPIFFTLGSLSAGLGVALGAFGAHALKARLSPPRLETFETGVRYHLVHALALLGSAFAAGRWPASSLPVIAGWLFVAGTLLFSGSLYLLSLSGRRWLGAITPLGGVAFIAGWLCLALAAV